MQPADVAVTAAALRSLGPQTNFGRGLLRFVLLPTFRLRSIALTSRQPARDGKRDGVLQRQGRKPSAGIASAARFFFRPTKIIRVPHPARQAARAAMTSHRGKTWNRTALDHGAGGGVAAASSCAFALRRRAYPASVRQLGRGAVRRRASGVRPDKPGARTEGADDAGISERAGGGVGRPGGRRPGQWHTGDDCRRPAGRHDGPPFQNMEYGAAETTYVRIGPCA